LFGLAGRRWLDKLELPADERETIDASLRQIDFLEQEIAEADRVIATDALASPEVKRLMTVPGVNVITAATFRAAVGDVRRFATPRRVVGYLGLDPRVRQSGQSPAKHGHISKQDSAPARYALVEGAWSVIRQPGPLRAFYERIRARRGAQVAIVATARKLACLFWCLLTREEDYAFAQPTLTKKKLRRLEIAAGAERGKVKPGVWSTNKALGKAERALAEQGEVPTDGSSTSGSRSAKGRAREFQWGAISKSSSVEETATQQDHWPQSCSLARAHPRPAALLQKGGQTSRGT
jgi:hypothetical protein